jgi:hypothetical protein
VAYQKRGSGSNSRYNYSVWHTRKGEVGAIQDIITQCGIPEKGKWEQFKI